MKRLLRYVKGTEDMSTVFEVRDSNDRRELLVKRLEVYTDSDWASDQNVTKEHERCGDHGRRHEVACSQSWSASVALSRGEAEGMAASEGVLMFAGLGHYEIEVKVDSCAAHAFFKIDEVLDA